MVLIFNYFIASFVSKSGKFKLLDEPRTTISQDVQTRFPVQLAFAKFLSRIKGNF